MRSTSSSRAGLLGHVGSSLGGVDCRLFQAPSGEAPKCPKQPESTRAHLALPSTDRRRRTT
eukprot:15423534-Alexandrium_andersonii.AAC.1